jgi:hypothetical protein
MADKDNSAHVYVFEMYANVEAYKAHLETAHFMKYKTTVQNMVKSLKLRDTVPILLRGNRCECRVGETGGFWLSRTRRLWPAAYTESPSVIPD